MIIDTIPFLFLIITITTLGAALILFVRAYTKISLKLHESEKRNSEFRNKLTEKPLQLLEKAHEQAQDIINHANEQASLIIASSQTYEKDSNQTLKEKLADLEAQQEVIFAKISEEMRQTYQQLMHQIQSEDINTLTALTKDIQADFQADFKEFRTNIEKETINTERIVREKIDEEYLIMKKDLEEYKKQQYQKVDADIYNILYRVSQMVLNQGIPYDKHKELVLEALETAKQEQVFQ
jgi:F0F1-type ATP synthase membrane subunit b/b'